MILPKSPKNPVDYPLLFLVIGLVLFGVLMVYNSSVVTAFRDFSDKYFYVRQQAISAVLGVVALLVFSRIDYHFYFKGATLFLLGTLFFLFLVLIPGIGLEVMGARRWLNLGIMRFQPAEVAKLTLVIYFSAVFSRKVKLISFLGVLGLVIGLIMVEPDLGTTIVLVLTSLSIYFASGASPASLMTIGTAGFLGGVVLILTSGYRRARLVTFLDMGQDPLGVSYHIRQALLALGSGGLLGVGLGASRQKYEYLPESMTDSIFAIIGEEVGFFGSSLLILAFSFLIWRGFRIARESPDSFGQLLAVGITSWIAIQAGINLASMVALVPLTGVPLPFISFGGSSLIVIMSAVGILLNISKSRVSKATLGRKLHKK